ncbi:MAG TPA: pyruvate formate lyase family protein [Candidatus Limnocylindria bacterium]|nr:pyruvate formate lyase family protein [Candidatus Limnocylindria bacterium]
MDISYEIGFTRVHRETAGLHPAKREAACLRAMYPRLCPEMQPRDLFAGRTLVMEYRGVGFSPDVTLYGLPHGMGYFYREDFFQKALAEADAAQAEEIRALMEYWRRENTTAKVKAAFTPRIREALPSDQFAGDVGIGFPLYRMTGAYIDYETLVREGLPGLRDRAAKGIQNDFTAALADMLDMVGECCLHYAAQADALGKPEAAQALRAVTKRPPQTLREAIQLTWLYGCLAGVMDYGRMDVYLGGFLAKDLQNGRLDREGALALLVGLWELMVARRTVYHGRVVIGGMGRPNEREADEFALLAMEASRLVRGIEPQLTLRLYKGQDPRLYEKGLEVIATGATYPMLYNDDVNVPAVMTAFDISREDAEQYVPFGCGEYVIDHKSFGSPNGVINMLKALEATLFDGRELLKGHRMGLSEGGLLAFDTFEELYAAYKRQAAHYIEVLAETEKIILDDTGRDAPFLMMSLLHDGCLESGKGMLEGGLRWLGATLESYGNTNAVDSLQAIREIVYEKKLVSRETLLKALQSDFEGYEAERELLLSARKYGNNLPDVDGLARDLHDFEARCIRDQAARVGLHSLLMVVINNSANTFLGRWTGASADGRRAREYMANANNPVGGQDKRGVTAMLLSLASFPSAHHAGTVQNLKLSRSLFRDAPDKVKALMDTYFALGGTQLMVNVLSRGDLEDAMAHPERHQGLLVRVGGFSAYFVTLEKDVQMEILSRTLH